MLKTTKHRVLCAFLTSILVSSLAFAEDPKNAAADFDDPNIPLIPQKRVWHELKTPSFLLLGDAPLGRMKDAATSMERLLGVLQRIAPKPVEPPVSTVVYVFRNRKEFNQFGIVYKGEIKELGGYFMTRDHANFITISSTNFDTSRATVQHELVHYFMSYNMPGLPLWVGEGLAELYSNFQVAGKFANIGRFHDNHLYWLNRNEMLPVLDLFKIDHRSPDYNEGDRRGVFYSQSWLLIHYLLLGSDGGEQQLLRFLDLSRTLPLEEAVNRSFERSPEELLKELQRYLRSTRFTYRRAELDRSRQEAGYQQRQLSTAEVRARLGELLAMHRDRPRLSEAYLRSALEQEPMNIRAHLGLGFLKLYPKDGEPDFDQALNHFAQAKAADPGDVTINYLMASVQARRGDPPKPLRPLLARIVNAKPQWGRAWKLLAWAWHPVTDDLEQKIAVFTGALRMHPDEEEYAQTLLDLYRKTDQAQKAEALIQGYFQPRGILLDLGTPISLQGESHGDDAEGRDFADRFAAQRQQASRLREQAESLVEQQQYSQALEIYQQLTELGPGYEARRDELANVVAHNKFLAGYNRAVKLFNELRWRDTVEELEDLLKEISNEEHVAKAQKLLDQARKERQKRGDSGA